MPINSVDA
jgi:WD40 repeat protein